MSSFFEIQAFMLMGELFFVSSLIVTLAYIAAISKTASRRHLMWLAAFGVLLALPLLAEFLPSFVRFVVPAPLVPLATELTPATAVAVEPPSSPIDASVVAFALLLFWLAGTCWVLLRALFGMWSLRALRAESVPHEFTDLPGIDARCELRISTDDEQCGPVTWGLFHPLILLPKDSVFWSRERLEAVLLHETAHIERRDSIAQLASLIACALYWPNPLVWMAAHNMRREAEMAADDAVIVSGVKPSAYAEELVQLASEFRSQRLSLAMPLFMAGPSALESRVESVLSPNKQRSGVTSMDVFKIACAGLLASTALVLARPSLAQDAPQAIPPVAPVVTSQALPPPAAPSEAPAAAAPRDMPAPPSEAPPPPSVAPAMAAIPAAPAAPSVEADGALPATEPLPPIPPLPPNDDVQVRTRIHQINGEEMKRVRIIVQRAREEAREAMAKARPEIERAQEQARQAQVQAREAMEKAQPEMERAMAQVRASQEAMREAQPQIEAALKNVQPEIDRAMAEARAQIDKADIDLKVKEKVDAALQRVEVRIQEREHKKVDNKDSHEDDESDSSEHE